MDEAGIEAGCEREERKTCKKALLWFLEALKVVNEPNHTEPIDHLSQGHGWLHGSRACELCRSTSWTS